MTIERIRAVAEDLRGTCQSLDSVIQKHFEDNIMSTELPTDLLEELDSIVMECQECNWWVEAHEVNDEAICDECSGRES